MYRLVGNGKQYNIRAMGVRDLKGLTIGREYVTLKGIETGIFDNSPYVSILGDYGQLVSGIHASRFEIVSEVQNDNK